MGEWIIDKDYEGYIYNNLTGQIVEDYTNRVWVGDRLAKFENDISKEELYKLLINEDSDKEILISVYNGYTVEGVLIHMKTFRKLLLDEAKTIKYNSHLKIFIDKDMGNY